MLGFVVSIVLARLLAPEVFGALSRTRVIALVIGAAASVGGRPGCVRARDRVKALSLRAVGVSAFVFAPVLTGLAIVAEPLGVRAGLGPRRS